MKPPQLRESVGQGRSIEPGTGGSVSDRDLFDLEVPAVGLDFGLEEMGAGLNTAIKHHQKRVAGEKLESAGHIGQTRAQKQPAEQGPAAADKRSFPRTVDNAASLRKTCPEDAIRTGAHGLPELRHLGRVMAKPGVDLKNPVGPRIEGLAITSNVCVYDAAILRGPDDPQTGLVQGIRTEQFRAAIGGGPVQNGEK